MAKLNLADVKYLALEGGGGKGFAYLGALEKLRDLGIYAVRGGRLLGLKGVAGTSAGAITAMFLTSGMGPDEIRAELRKTDFSKKFDTPDPARKPGIYGEKKPSSEPTLSLNPNPRQAAASEPLSETEEGLFRVLQLLIPGVLEAEEAVALAAVLAEVSGNIASRYTDPPANLLLQDVLKSLQCLNTGWGFFVGDRFLNYFDQVLRAAADKVIAAETGQKPSPSQKEQPYMTFLRHRQVFKTTLAVIGTNLETMRSVLFSWKTTPRVPVAAAVRISMGIPILFKPIEFRDMGGDEIYKVTDREPPDPVLGFKDLVGVWVDGGLLNNIPLQVFDDNLTPSRQVQPGAPAEPRTAQHQTLGLRLDISDDQRKPIRDLGSLLKAISVGMILGAGEAHINRSLSTFDRTILLDTTGLSTLDFKEPPKAIADEVLKKSREAVENYFKGAR